MAYWRKFIRLPWSTKRTLFQVALLLPLARVALVVFPFRVVAQFAERSVDRRRTGAADPRFEREVTWAASGLGRIMLADRPCLTQALVVQWLLARKNMSATLRFGVNKTSAGKLVAHAWLERDGRNIIGGRQAHFRYVPMTPVRANDLTAPARK